MARGTFKHMLRGTISLMPELKQTKNGKLVLNINCAYTKFKPQGSDSKYVTVTVWGTQAQIVYNKFVSGEYQVGDIMHVDDGDLEIFAYNGKDGALKYKILLTPLGHTRKQRNAEGNAIMRENGQPVTDFWYDFEITPGKNHVWQSECVPEPKEEREAIPPEEPAESTPDYVQVEDGELPF